MSVKSFLFYFLIIAQRHDRFMRRSHSRSLLYWMHPHITWLQIISFLHERLLCLWRRSCRIMFYRCILCGRHYTLHRRQSVRPSVPWSLLTLTQKPYNVQNLEQRSITSGVTSRAVFEVKRSKIKVSEAKMWKWFLARIFAKKMYRLM